MYPMQKQGQISGKVPSTYVKAHGKQKQESEKSGIIKVRTRIRITIINGLAELDTQGDKAMLC